MTSNIEIIKDDVDVDSAEQQFFLKKPVGAIYITNKSLTNLARRVFNVLLKNAQESMLDQEDHEMGLEAFRLGLESDSNNTYLKDCFKRIMGTVVEFNYIDRDKKNIWQASVLVSDVKILNNQRVIYNSMFEFFKFDCQTILA